MGQNKYDLIKKVRIPKLLQFFIVALLLTYLFVGLAELVSLKTGFVMISYSTSERIAVLAFFAAIVAGSIIRRHWK